MQVKGVCTFVIEESLITSQRNKLMAGGGVGVGAGFFRGWSGFFPTTNVGNIFCFVC